LPTPLLPDNADPNQVAPTAIPTKVPLIDRKGYDLVNIMLLGIDSELTGDNIDRTDTMIIVSINRTTNTVSMLSLPRDLYVYIPGWTMQRLNLAFTHGEQAGWTGGGFGLLRQTIFYNFGINVHYYVEVKLSGFKEIINTLGGVNLTIDCAIQDRELIGAEPPVQATGPDAKGNYVLPIGAYTLNGDGALWYARSRHSSSDFDRGRRQQQLLRAIWRAARNSGQMTKLPELWSQLTQVVKTDLKFEDMLGLLPYAVNIDPDRIEHFVFQRLYHTTPWQPPDGANVQLPVPDTVQQLMEDFYTPPSESQIALSGVKIEVRNGTANADWDRVAADRLAWSGFNAIASGNADNTDYSDTILIDHTGQTKGSKIADIVKILNVKPENIRIEPDSNRTADYEIILGSKYNSCTYQVLQPDETGG
jgi:LCP family protein required for cell wall assembly